MGRQKLAAGGVTPLVLSMYQQAVVSKPQFGLYLIRDSSKPGAGGEMALGGYNQQRIAGKLTWCVEFVLRGQLCKHGSRRQALMIGLITCLPE
jgi:hypothetical protein